MYWLLFSHLAIDSFIRDVIWRKISNRVLIFHLCFLIRFFDWKLIGLAIAPWLTKWVGAGDFKLIAVIYLYSKALDLNLTYWLVTSSIIGLATAVIMRNKSIPFSPALLFGALLSDNMARDWLKI